MCAGFVSTAPCQSQFFAAREFFDGGFTATGAGTIVARLSKNHLFGSATRVKILCPGAILMLCKTSLNIGANARVQGVVAGADHIHAPVSSQFQTLISRQTDDTA